MVTFRMRPRVLAKDRIDLSHGRIVRQAEPVFRRPAKIAESEPIYVPSNVALTATERRCEPNSLAFWRSFLPK